MEQYRKLCEDIQNSLVNPKPNVPGSASGTTTIANNSNNLDPKTLGNVLSLDPAIQKTVRAVLAKRQAKAQLSPEEKRVSDLYDRQQAKFKTDLAGTANNLQMQLSSVDSLLLKQYCALITEADIPQADMPLDSPPGAGQGPTTVPQTPGKEGDVGNGDDLAKDILDTEGDDEDEDLTKTSEGQVYLIDLTRRAFLIDPQEVTIGPEDKQELMIKTTPKNAIKQLDLLKSMIASYELPSEPSV